MDSPTNAYSSVESLTVPDSWEDLWHDHDLALKRNLDDDLVCDLSALFSDWAINPEAVHSGSTLAESQIAENQDGVASNASLTEEMALKVLNDDREKLAFDIVSRAIHEATGTTDDQASTELRSESPKFQMVEPMETIMEEVVEDQTGAFGYDAITSAGPSRCACDYEPISLPQINAMRDETTPLLPSPVASDQFTYCDTGNTPNSPNCLFLWHPCRRGPDDDLPEFRPQTPVHIIDLLARFHFESEDQVDRYEARLAFPSFSQSAIERRETGDNDESNIE